MTKIERFNQAFERFIERSVHIYNKILNFLYLFFYALVFLVFEGLFVSFYIVGSFLAFIKRVESIYFARKTGLPSGYIKGALLKSIDALIYGVLLLFNCCYATGMLVYDAAKTFLILVKSFSLSVVKKVLDAMLIDSINFSKDGIVWHIEQISMLNASLDLTKKVNFTFKYHQVVSSINKLKNDFVGFANDCITQLTNVFEFILGQLNAKLCLWMMVVGQALDSCLGDKDALRSRWYYPLMNLGCFLTFGIVFGVISILIINDGEESQGVLWTFLVDVPKDLVKIIANTIFTVVVFPILLTGTIIECIKSVFCKHIPTTEPSPRQSSKLAYEMQQLRSNEKEYTHMLLNSPPRNSREEGADESIFLKKDDGISQFQKLRWVKR